jgi:uncharacterized RDD family membrane protein YckC
MRTSLICAGRGERFLAYLLDMLFILIPVRLVAALFVGTDNSGEPTIEPVFFLVMFLINAAYYTGFTASRWQATPGKRLLGMYVIRTDHQRLSLSSALERFLAFTLPFMPVYVSFIPPAPAKMLTMILVMYWFLPILYTQERVGIHDRLCRTRVLIGRVG